MLRILEVAASVVQPSHSLEADHFIEKSTNLGVGSELREAGCIVGLKFGIFCISILTMLSFLFLGANFQSRGLSSYDR